MFSSVDMDWAAYEGKQCKAGYTGVVCSVCAKSYGQTDIFSCEKCVDEGNKRGSIIWVWVAYFLVFLVYLMVTVIGHLKENPPPHSGQATGTDTDAVIAQGRDDCGKAAHMALPDTTEVAKALVMYIQYFGGVIAKLPISWPEPLRTISSRVSLVFGWVTGSAASIDCLLSLYGVEGAARAGLKGLINLLAPFATFLAMMLLLIVWWVVRQPVYALAAKSTRKEVQGLWHWHAAVLRRCISSAAVADGLGGRFLWLQSKARRPHDVLLGDYLCQRMVPVALIAAFFWYPSIARIVLGMRACMKVCGTRYWVMDMRLLCPLDTPGEPQAVWSTAVTIPAAIITAGLPLLVLVVLSGRNWKSRMHKLQFLCWFGFLYSDYNYSDGALPPQKGSTSVASPGTPHAGQQGSCPGVAAGCTWLASMIPVVINWLFTSVRPRIVAAWDVIVHITTLLLTFCSVYGVYGMHEYYQVLLLSTIFAAYLCAVMWVRPFKGFMQHIQVFIAVVLLCTCLCILALIPPKGLDERQQEIISTVSVAIGYLIIIGNALCVVGLVLLLLLLSVFGRSEHQSDSAASSGSSSATNQTSQTVP